MAPQTPSLPLIDFSSENSEPGTSSWLSTSKQVKDALENHGFFLVTCDKISSEVKNAFILAMKEFHDLPGEQKSRFTSDKPYLGYFGQARDGKPPILELTAIGDPTSIQAVEGFTNLFRSSGKKDHLREIILSYTKQVAELHELILKMVLEGYGVEKYYESLKESLAYICRVNKYRATEPNERDVAVVPHTDSSFMTILDQNEVNGLEVKSKDGSWVPVDFPPSSFALVAGDGLLEPKGTEQPSDQTNVLDTRLNLENIHDSNKHSLLWQLVGGRLDGHQPKAKGWWLGCHFSGEVLFLSTMKTISSIFALLFVYYALTKRTH